MAGLLCDLPEVRQLGTPATSLAGGLARGRVAAVRSVFERAPREHVHEALCIFPLSLTGSALSAAEKQGNVALLELNLELLSPDAIDVAGDATAATEQRAETARDALCIFCG
jgi:hypothetical protein